MLDRYAVIGNPIEHSLSPEIHHAFAKQTGQALSYEPLLAPLDQFVATVRHFIASGGKGCNITHPFKEQAFALVDKYSERAAQAKAVNTIILQPDGSLYGDNTDGIGLVRDLIINRDMILQNKQILILGAGGAVRGILGPLLAESPAQITVANRTIEKAEQLAREFPITACQLDNIPAQNFDLIINGTTTPSLRGRFLAAAIQYYDMNYANGGEGWGMLVEQAAEAFFLWRGIRPDTKLLLKNRPN